MIEGYFLFRLVTSISTALEIIIELRSAICKRDVNAVSSAVYTVTTQNLKGDLFSRGYKANLNKNFVHT